MGFGLGYLEYLFDTGLLKRGGSILDVGSQNLYHATPQRLRKIISAHGKIGDEADFKSFAELVSYFSTPRPNERTSFLADIMDRLDVRYTGIDVCPAPKTRIVDLNTETVPADMRGAFDVILNFGTSEHIFNQLNCFRFMHDALKVGGVFFHQLPSQGWVDHGFFCYHNTFFEELAAANGYEIVEKWYFRAGVTQQDEMDFDLRSAGDPNDKLGKEAAASLIKYNINVILRKVKDAPFTIGLELATSHAQLDTGVLSRYKSGAPLLPPELSGEIAPGAIGTGDLIRTFNGRTEALSKQMHEVHQQLSRQLYESMIDIKSSRDMTDPRLSQMPTLRLLKEAVKRLVRKSTKVVNGWTAKRA